MKLIIDASVLEKFPQVLLGVVIVNDIDNSGVEPALIDMLRASQTEALKKIEGLNLSEQLYIAPWREAYRQFGAKPKDYLSSIENLLKRISSGGEIRHINKLVDIYNVISLKHFVPVGGEDLMKIEGDILLTLAGENENPIKLLGEPEARPPHPGEVIYKDNQGAICRRWNWKEADRTKLTEETKNAVIVIEALPPIEKSTIEKALEDLSSLVEAYCGGNSISKILTKETPEITLK